MLKKKDFNLSLGSSNSNYLSSSLVDPSASSRLAGHPNVEFTRGLKCSWQFSSSLLSHKTVWPPEEARGQEQSSVPAASSHREFYLQQLSPNSQSPFMCFQNQNPEREREPSLEVLSWHINVMTHFTSIRLAEIMTNNYANINWLKCWDDAGCWDSFQDVEICNLPSVKLQPSAKY